LQPTQRETHCHLPGSSFRFSAFCFGSVCCGPFSFADGCVPDVLELTGCLLSAAVPEADELSVSSAWKP